MRKRRSGRRAIGTRALILVEARPSARVPTDFVHGQFATLTPSQRRRRCHLRGPDGDPRHPILSRVARELTALVACWGCGHDRQRQRHGVHAWVQDHGTDWHYIASGAFAASRSVAHPTL